MFPAAHGLVSQGWKVAPPPAAAAGGPAIVNFGTWATLSNDNHFGWVFTPERDITVVSLMLYNEVAASETVTIWRNDTDTVVAQAVVEAEGGWGETPLPAPVTLSAHVAYTIGRDAGAYRTYSRTPNQPYIDPTVTVNESYVIGATGVRPATVAGGVNTAYSVSFRTAADPVGWRYFRLSILENNGDSGMGLSTFGIAAEPEGPDLAVTEALIAPHAGATITSGSFPALVDGNTRTGAYHGSWSPPWEVVLDFGSSNQKEAVEHLIGAFYGTVSTAARSVKEWKVYGSNDRETWTELAHVTNETGWVIDEVRRYPF